MTPRPTAPPRQRVLTLAAVALLALARAAAAQAPALAGQVVDSAGKPVPDQHVTLHRVDQSSGAMVDSAVSDAGGRFTMHLPPLAAPGDTGGVYFAATRWQGQLYIGAPFKRAAIPTPPYLVTVGVNPVQMGPVGAEGGAGPAATEAQPPTPAASGNTGRWFLAIVLGLVALGAVSYALIGGTRERSALRRRVLLARIAELDERAQSAPADEAARLREQRAELVSQLTEE